jgi:hypothetical protein
MGESFRSSAWELGLEKGQQRQCLLYGQNGSEILGNVTHDKILRCIVYSNVKQKLAENCMEEQKTIRDLRENHIIRLAYLLPG